jgi:uncharacterized membrane protein (TIGR02234 family)
MTARRSPAGAVIGCAAGGLLVLLASGRIWARTTLHEVAGGGTATVTVTGHVVSPALPALGVALLALAAAILAARRWLRRAVGLVIVALGGAAIAVGVTGRGDVSSALEHREVGVQGLVVHASANGWWLVATLGGLLAVLSGALTVLRAADWMAMGAKYDAPNAPKRVQDPAVVAWDALDRGEDPTT